MRSKPVNLVERSAEARAAFEEAERAYERELAAIRRECGHEVVVECDEFSREPLRICTCCGAEEDGWGYGYAVLGPRFDRVPEVKHVSKEEFFSYRHGVGGRYLVYPKWAKR